MFKILFFVLFIVPIPICVIAQPDSVIVNGLYEIFLTSQHSRSDSPLSIETFTVFSNGSDAIDTVYGFWDGDSTYRVRAALPTTGNWSWTTYCSDSADTGLHGQTGDVTVIESTSGGEFAKHGWLQVSDDSRYLSHEDGTPFFWLGDTSWEITWKSYLEQVRAYLADRKKKKFNAIQIVVLSHQYLFDYGIRNRNGEVSFIQNNFALPNPAYFRYLDSIVALVNEHDMVAVLVPLWAAMTRVHNPTSPPEHRSLTEEQSLLFTRYVGARYGGYNVLWIVGGDNSYETAVKKEFWKSIGRTLKQYGGKRHLATVHPHGWGASYQYFESTEEWLDFHSYQSSHSVGGDYTWAAALEGYGKSPTKPVLNSEPNYEDIYSNIWLPGDTVHPGGFRVRPNHVRQASYESVLSGAIVGITYGGNGVWQWNTPENPGGHNPRFYVEKAWQMPGSEHMTVLKQKLSGLRWYNFRPVPEVLLARGTEDYIPVSTNDTLVVAYIPIGTDYLELNLLPFFDSASFYWINPLDGDRSTNVYFHPDVDLSRVRIVPPDPSDWLLVIQRSTGRPTDVIAREAAMAAPTVRTNSTTGVIDIMGSSGSAGEVIFELYSVSGALIYRESRMSSGIYRFSAQPSVSGAYFYSVYLAGTSGDVAVHRGKIFMAR